MAYRHRATQLSFQSFNNGLGVPLSSDNEWVQLADMLPWQQLDEAYQLLFTPQFTIQVQHPDDQTIKAMKTYSC